MSIEECALEVEFFTALRDELKKLSLFYGTEERRYLFRYHQLSVSLAEMRKETVIPDQHQAQRLIAAFVHFYRECIQLENFAIMNYNGFSKVLFIKLFVFSFFNIMK